MPQSRGLDSQFMNDLSAANGCLNPLLRRVQADTALDLEIRKNSLNVYYRGGSLVKVTAMKREPRAYTFTFNKRYEWGEYKGTLLLPDETVSSIDDTRRWVASISSIKDTMDLWFGEHPKDERALQQMVVWENNDSPWANSTDWFIIDIEYDNHQGARFDLVGLQWESTSSARKLSKAYLPRLAIFEMKAGDGALTGESGIETHLEQLRRFLSDRQQVQEFKTEMLTVFRQKRELHLIRRLRSNKNPVEAFDAGIDVILLVVGHDPASRTLADILQEVHRTKQAEIPGAAVRLCSANFMGFGLYKENMFTLPAFVKRFATQIGHRNVADPQTL